MRNYFLLGAIALATISCLYEKGPDPKGEVSGNTSTNTNGSTNGNNTNSTGTTGTSTSDICGLVSGSTTNSTSGSISTEICFTAQIMPIFISNCAMSGCHDAKSKREGYDLSSYDSIIKKGIIKGDAAKSKIYKVLLANGESRMPPAPMQALSADKIQLIANWINQGAKNSTCQSANTGTLPDSTIISYSKHIKPLIDTYCLGCHNGLGASGGVQLDSYTNIKVYANNGLLYGTIAQLNGYAAMPVGGKLTDCEIKAFKLWIDQGKQNN